MRGSVARAAGGIARRSRSRATAAGSRIRGPRAVRGVGGARGGRGGLRLPEFPAGGPVLAGLYEDANVGRLKRAVLESEGTVLASPIYNWQLAATLKRAVEILGEHG